MADVFVSYAREDQDWVRQLARALIDEGLTVWWDQSIPTGRGYAKVIAEALSNARCVMVVWSAQSIQSTWVQEEAEDGRSRSVLIPVFKQVVTPPLGFRSLQASDLSTWDGDRADPRFRRVMDDLSQHFGIAPPPKLPEATILAGQIPPETESKRPPRPEPPPESSRSFPAGLPDASGVRRWWLQDATLTLALALPLWICGHSYYTEKCFWSPIAAWVGFAGAVALLWGTRIRGIQSIPVRSVAILVGWGLGAYLGGGILSQEWGNILPLFGAPFFALIQGVMDVTSRRRPQYLRPRWRGWVVLTGIALIIWVAVLIPLGIASEMPLASQGTTVVRGVSVALFFALLTQFENLARQG
jgi:hypothetical protein